MPRHTIQLPPPSQGKRMSRLLQDECGKRRYATRELAEQALQGITWGRKIIVTVYECQHGWFHIGMERTNG